MKKAFISFADDVVMHRLQQLPKGAREIFKPAVAIGGKFTTELFAAVVHKSVPEMLELVQNLLNEGLIVPLASLYEKLPGVSGNTMGKMVHNNIHTSHHLIK